MCTGAFPFPHFPGKKGSVCFLFLKPSEDFREAKYGEEGLQHKYRLAVRDIDDQTLRDSDLNTRLLEHLSVHLFIRNEKKWYPAKVSGTVCIVLVLTHMSKRD